MKFSLRNLALAGAMTLAGVAMAQDAPTVTQKWITKLGFDSGDYRGGTGVNGTVYLPGGSVLKAVNADGVKDIAVSGYTLNKGMTSDDAGNLLILKGWPSASATENAILISADHQTIKEIKLAKPTEDADFPIGRSDVQGRAIGDFFSEEGGAFFLTSSGEAGKNVAAKNYPIVIVIKNGECETVEYSTDARMAAANSMASAVPSVETMEDLFAEDTPENCFYYRTGSQLSDICYYDPESTIATYTNASTLKVPTVPEGYKLISQNGFDVFTLGDVRYQVRPVGRNATPNWNSDFVISNDEGEVIFCTKYADEYISDAQKTGNGCNLVARKVSDYKVELYQVYTTTQTGISFAAMYEITIPGGEDPTPAAEPLYITGDQFGGFDAVNPQEMTYADGKYTVEIANAGTFKVSTAKGDWVAFNGAALGIADEWNTEYMELGKEYTYTVGRRGNYGVEKNGTYVFTVDLEAGTAVLTGEVAKEPAPEALYLIGDLSNNWNPADAVELVKDEDNDFYRAEAVEFTAAADKEVSYFCVFGQKDWSPLRFGPKVNGQLIEDYDVVEMFTNQGDNAWTVAAGKYDVFVNWEKQTIALSPYEEPVPQIKVNYWTNFGEEMEPEAQQMMMTEGSEGSEYTLVQDYMAGAFYFTTEMGLQSTIWGADSEDYENGVEIKVGEKTALAPEGAQFIVPGKGLTDATITLTFDSEGGFVKVEGTPVPDDDPIENPTADKAHFVYNVKHEGHNDGIYTIKFHSTGDAPKAVIVLHEVDGTEELEAELGKVVKGENTFTYDANDLNKDKNYTWSVRLHGYEVPEVKISEPISYTEGGGRAGIVVFTDPAYPEVYGKVVLCPASARNLYVYAADGTLEKTVDVTTSPFNQSGNANNSSPMDGKQRGNEAVFANWGDSSNGVVAYNVVTDEIYGVFEGTKASNGAITNADGEYVGSGTPCLAFQGKGEDTKLFTFDEDCFGNNLAMNPIGAAKTTSKKAENWGLKSLLANTNVGLWPAENGLWLTQVRGDGMDATTALSYLDIEEQDVVWSIRDAAAANGYDPDNKDLTDEKSGLHFCPSSAAGVCVNPAGDLLALSTYDGVEVYLLGWEENAMGTLLPTLEKYATVAYPGGRSTVRTNVQFDAANNLYVQQQGTKSFYTVTLAEKEPIALTDAHSDYTIANPSAVANIAVDAANGNAVYYNLNGVRVNGKLAAGVYVKVVDGKATKVVVK